MWTRTRTYVTPPSRWRWSACALRTGVGIGRCPPKRAPHHTLTTALQQQQCSVSERGFLYNRFQEERGGREGGVGSARPCPVCVCGVGPVVFFFQDVVGSEEEQNESKSPKLEPVAQRWWCERPAASCTHPTSIPLLLYSPGTLPTEF